jgi:hypothetical protein
VQPIVLWCAQHQLSSLFSYTERLRFDCLSIRSQADVLRVCMYVVTAASIVIQHVASAYADSDIRLQNAAVPVLTLERMQTLLQLPVDTAIDSAAADLLARMLKVNPNDRISIRYFIHIICSLVPAKQRNTMHQAMCTVMCCMHRSG